MLGDGLVVVALAVWELVVLSMMILVISMTTRTSIAVVTIGERVVMMMVTALTL